MNTDDSEMNEVPDKDLKRMTIRMMNEVKQIQMSE
jgi:hypothetical protein